VLFRSPVQSYSSGMSVRLGFAVAIALEPGILLLDEVLAVGDEGFQKKCLNKIGELRKKGTSIILVSHNMHTISTYSNKALLMANGAHSEYKDVSAGIKAYKKSCLKDEDQEIEKICSGNNIIKFNTVDISNSALKPGESFNANLTYSTKTDYLNAEIDIAIWTNQEITFYFQATNKAYGKIVDLKKYSGFLHIQVKDIRINNAIGKISITIWSQNREELIFWWRIPIEFHGVAHSTGNTFLDISYEYQNNSLIK
jgi:lipopolysaccharide transport system ATP-binding protein